MNTNHIILHNRARGVWEKASRARPSISVTSNYEATLLNYGPQRPFSVTFILRLNELSVFSLSMGISVIYYGAVLP